MTSWGAWHPGAGEVASCVGRLPAAGGGDGTERVTSRCGGDHVVRGVRERVTLVGDGRTDGSMEACCECLPGEAVERPPGRDSSAGPGCERRPPAQDPGRQERLGLSPQRSAAQLGAAMDTRRQLAFAIVRFLQDQLRHGGLSADAQESLEVAIQCLETAFGVSAEDGGLALPQTLAEIFEAAAAKETRPDLAGPELSPPSEEDSAEAERLKTEGNEQMKAENFQAAVLSYGKAIELNPANAVYFCNRAAAFSKLGNYADAVQDCERAIRIDPAYSKAYGRMGLALSSLNKHAEAVAYYRKALQLDPDNDAYRANLRVAELKLREAPTSPTSSFDIAGLLTNPSFMSMASNLMSHPQLQQLMSGMISGGHTPLGTPGSSPSQNDLSSLIQAGQQFAQQIQQQNPELVEQLRSQMRSRPPSSSTDDPQE